MRPLKLTALALALAIAPMPAAAQPAPVVAPAVLASPDRTPDNVKLDESRKPAGLLQFLGLKPGMQVLDVFAAKQKNVSLISSPFEAPNFPKRAFDFALINLDYHDVYWQSAERKIPRMDPDAWLKTLYAAMKPGGIVGVVDHVGGANTGARAVGDGLHRIGTEEMK